MNRVRSTVRIVVHTAAVSARLTRCVAIQLIGYANQAAAGTSGLYGEGADVDQPDNVLGSDNADDLSRIDNECPATALGIQPPE